MRDKNKWIYQFILDLEREKSRERASRDKILREEFLRAAEQPVIEHADIGTLWTETLNVGTYKFERRSHHYLGMQLGISIVLAAFSFISIIVLLQIDALVHQSFYSFGLQSALKLITPYWIAINTVLGVFWFMAIRGILFKMHALTHKGT